MAWGDFLDNLGNVFKPKSIGVSSAAALSLFQNADAINTMVENGGGGLTTEHLKNIDATIGQANYGLSQIGFVSDRSYTMGSWTTISGVTIDGNHFRFNKNGDSPTGQTKTTITSQVVNNEKYLLLVNLDNIIVHNPIVTQIVFYNYTQGIHTLDIADYISSGKKLLVIPFTSLGDFNLLQVIAGPLTNVAQGIPADELILEFDSNFIGFVPWTKETEDYWNYMRDTYKYGGFTNTISPRALIADKALSSDLPSSSFVTTTSLANREQNKISVDIVTYTSNSGTTSNYNTYDGVKFDFGAVADLTANPSARGWFGFDIKPANYELEDKTYVVVLEGTVTAMNIINMVYTTALGIYDNFAQDLEDGVETNVKFMLTIPYTAGTNNNSRYTYTRYTRRDTNIAEVSFDASFTTFAVFEYVEGYSIDDYILANKESIIVPKYVSENIATKSFVSSSVESFQRNAYKLSGNDFNKVYDNEMFLSGGQSLNVGGGASNTSTEFKNTLCFIGGDDVYPFDLTTQPLRDAFFGTELVPIKDSTAKYPPVSASVATMLSLLDEENNVDVTEFGGSFIPFAWGVSGNSITTMEKGTDAYNVMLEAVTKAKEFSYKTGKTFGVRGMNWYHGEADSGQTYQWYYDKLNQLFIDVNTDVKAITGQSEDIQFFTYQTSAWLDRLHPHINIQEAQVQVSKDNANVHLAGAMYQFAYNDTFHPSDRAVIGMQTGVAIKRVIYDNKEWKGFTPISHQVITDGTNYYIHLKFDVPVKPCRFDVSGDAWHNPRGKEVNYGFEVLSGGVEKQIAEPFIVKGDTVVLTLSEDPSGMTIRYAVNGHEGGGNLCDSQNIIVRNKNIDYVIDNFAVSFSSYIID
jgi:hypothetical protein